MRVFVAFSEIALLYLQQAHHESARSRELLKEIIKTMDGSRKKVDCSRKKCGWEPS